MGSETFHTLKKIIASKYGSQNTSVGDEGGFAPMVHTPKEALDLLNEAVSKSGYEGKIMYALDVAASEFYDENSKLYDLGFKSRSVKQGRSLD